MKAAIVVGVGALIIWELAIVVDERRRRRRLSTRDNYSMDEWFERFEKYGLGPRPDVEELLTAVARPLGIAPGQIRPDDRLAIDYAYQQRWIKWLHDDSLEYVNLSICAWMKQRGIKLASWPETPTTIGDVIQFLCFHVPRHNIPAR